MSRNPDELHPALRRLTRLAELEELDARPSLAEWQRFLHVVSDTLTASDRDRELLERAIEITSEEMLELNDKLEFERQLLNEALGSLETIVLNVRDDGTISYVNPAFAAVTGIRRDVVGESFHDVLSVESDDGDLLTIARQLESSGRWRSEHCQVRFWRGEISADVTIAKVGAASPGPNGFIISIADVTERVLAQELARSALHEAEAARRAKAAQAAFLANMSHELRTPLTAIIGYTELILETEPDSFEEMSQDLESILQASHHLVAMVSDVLDMSKIQAGKLEIEIMRTDTTMIVENARAATLPIIEKNGNRLIIDIEPQAREVYADPVRLTQTLVNLLGNAGKFTRDGTVRLEVRRFGPETLVFEVIDDGPGIREDLMPRLFSAFTQADSSTTRLFGGTGLGLALSKDFVERMNGTIEVESDFGKGSTFRFFLPTPQLNSEAEVTYSSTAQEAQPVG